MEKVVLKSNSSQAKVMGTIISISGAFVVTLYKGPRIIFSSPPTSLSLHHHHPLTSSDSNWVLGSLLLTSEYILVPLWYIVQVNFYHILLSIYIILDHLSVMKMFFLKHLEIHSNIQN